MCCVAKCLSVSHGLLCHLVAGSATRNADLSNALNDLCWCLPDSQGDLTLSLCGVVEN